MIYNKIDIRTLDFEFSGRNFKKELIKEMDNYVDIFNKKIKHIDVDYSNLIGETTGYKLIYTEKDCGGYCDYINKEIALGDPSYIIPTILHECVHSLQANVGILDISQMILSERIKIEQQCETMAHLLNLKIFKDNSPDKFDSYFSKESFIWLGDWYGDFVQNDLIL